MRFGGTNPKPRVRMSQSGDMSNAAKSGTVGVGKALRDDVKRKANT
jgi:hypothetical protein